MDPVADAHALVAERFPAAVAAFLGPGILSDRRTATSDLDIVVVLPGPPAPYRESLRWRGWPAELFVHDAGSLERYFAKDTARRRATLARLCTDGVVLSGGQNTTDQIRERGRSLLAAGPPPLTTTELDLARYGLTDLLDDLAGSTDPAETAVIGWHVWTAAAELALLLGGHWLGTGKWLVRELRAAEPALAGRFAAAIGTGAIGTAAIGTGAIGEQGQQLTQLADEVLDRAGGRFWAGLRVQG